MIVTCPECATRYRVDDAAFSDGGRAVRCNHCRCEWYQIGPASGSGPGRPHAIELGTANIEGGARGGGDPLPPRPAAPNPAAPRPAAPPPEEPAPLRAEHALHATNDHPRRATGRGERLVAERDVNSDPPVSAKSAKPFSARQSADKIESFSHSVPVVVDPDDIRATGARSLGRGGRGRRGSLVRGVLMSLATLAVLGPVAFYHFGPQLADKMPEAAEAVGVYRDKVDEVVGEVFATPVASGKVQEGVVFVDYKYDLVERQEGPALEVWGRVANNGPTVALTPTIEIVSRNENGEALQRWLARPDLDQLKPGESAKFVSRMMYPLGPVFDVDLYIAAQ